MHSNTTEQQFPALKRMTDPLGKRLNHFLLMGKQYYVCHLLTGHSYSFWFLGDSFFFFSILRALVVHFCCYSWDFFFFFNISFKEIQRLRHTSPVSQTDLLCMHSPSVQFLDCKTRPSQSLPPFLGAGAVHSLLRQ